MKKVIKLIIAVTVLVACVCATFYALDEKHKTKYIKISGENENDLLTEM